VKFVLALALALATLVLAAQPVAAQCAMCQTAVTGSPEGRSMSGQLNQAILLMFVAPYVVFSSFLLLAFRHRIRRRARAFAQRFPSLRPQRSL
jgi:hypothetical protein